MVGKNIAVPIWIKIKYRQNLHDSSQQDWPKAGL